MTFMRQFTTIRMLPISNKRAKTKIQITPTIGSFIEDTFLNINKKKQRLLTKNIMSRNNKSLNLNRMEANS